MHTSFEQYWAAIHGKKEKNVYAYAGTMTVSLAADGINRWCMYSEMDTICFQKDVARI